MRTGLLYSPASRSRITVSRSAAFSSVSRQARPTKLGPKSSAPQACPDYHSTRLECEFGQIKFRQCPRQSRLPGRLLVPIPIRSHVRTLVAAHRADELVFEIGQPHIV